MELMNPWVKQGWEDGRKEGKEELVASLIHRRFGSVTSEVTEQLRHLSSKQLNALGLALFDFKTSADLETWLSKHKAQ